MKLYIVFRSDAIEDVETDEVIGVFSEPMKAEAAIKDAVAKIDALDGPDEHSWIETVNHYSSMVVEAETEGMRIRVEEATLDAMEWTL